MEFFIPDLADDPAAAEQRWGNYVARSGAPVDSRRVYQLTYTHGSSRFVVTVGQPRQEYRRKTGPRGGYIKNADFLGYATPTGTMVSAIIDAPGPLLYVWSYGPPFGGWANPSFVGRGEVTDIQHFDAPSSGASSGAR